MGLNNIWDNPLMNVDVYYCTTPFLKINSDWEVAHMYNRSAPMILYGFNELVRKVLNVRIDVAMVMEAEEHARAMGVPFNTGMWMEVVEHFKGRIPIKVQALPDGTWVPTGAPFAQIENTEEGFGECAFYFEGVLMHAYFPSGCATEAFYIKQYLESKGLPLHRVHSFGYRGHRSQEDAYWAGTAWNLFLTGTDDFHTKMHTTAPVKSIMASAHKVIQQFDDEMEAYKFQIDAAKTQGTNIVAFPIDTHDPDRFIDKYIVPVLEYAKQQGVHVVLRPDSGDVVGQAIRIYKAAITHDFKNVNVIIGEGMSLQKMKEYDERLTKEGVPLIFVFYGIGAGFYNHIERDTLGWAMKAAYSNGKNRMKTVKSNPYKQSIAGVVNIIEDNGELMVEYTRNGLYVNIFDYDNRTDRPYTHVQTWSDIQKIAQQQTGKQQRIKLSPSVQAERERIMAQYA